VWHPYIELQVYPIFFKYQNAVDLSMLDFSAISSVRELFCTKLRNVIICQKIGWSVIGYQGGNHHVKISQTNFLTIQIAGRTIQSVQF